MSKPEKRAGLMVRLPPDVKLWIETESKRNGSSQNSEVIRAVRSRMTYQQAEKRD